MNRFHKGLSGTALGLATLALGLPVATMATGATAGGLDHGVVQVLRHVDGTADTNQSSNWSGYNIGADYPQVTTGTLFTSISGQWTVPTATQHTSGQAEDSATWIGIGGGCIDDSCDTTDSTLIQAGTEQDVSKKGKVSYGAWWEIIPETETAVSLPVSAGNKIDVSISQTSTPGDWSILIKNLSTGQQFTTTTEYSSSEDTVEWIEETPLEIGTTGTGIAAMPNLTPVHFGHATYNGANPAFQSIDEMQLDNSSMIEATPSAPGPKLNSFRDCTWATSCAAP
jgi:hypothetical protein